MAKRKTTTKAKALKGAAPDRLGATIKMAEQKAKAALSAHNYIEIEDATREVGQGVATLYLVADGLPSTDEAKDACTFIADNMKRCTDKLQAWFDGEPVVGKGGAA